MTEMRRDRVYRQTATVKIVEERFKPVHDKTSGVGKDAKAVDVSDGWWVTFTDNPTAVRCETKPDCQPGDKAVCTWEFHKS